MTARTTTAVPGSVEARRSSGIWRDAMGRLFKNRLAVLGLLFVIFLAVLGTIGPNFAPYRYDFQDTPALIENLFIPIPPLQHPTHYLGTDELGHDILSRIMDGAQISLSVALVVQLVVLVIGLPLGAIAGWFGGRIDTYLMRFTDVMYAFPDLLLIILMSVAFRDTAFGRLYSGLFLVFIAIGLTSWVTVARLVRGQLLSLKEMEFVEAAKALGVRDRNIVMRHLLPNAIGPIIVAVTLGIPGAILAEATLAYLGVGVQAPRASWGSLIAAGQDQIRFSPHLVYIPGIMIALALISFTFLGDGLRDALDPKLKGKQ
ncbi:MAG TPA: ABC transporter permease [Candidatus Limnocylindrales bacterium]|nr:ABC transporter permease [Candidatus Limnocylindrales bacterium]